MLDFQRNGCDQCGASMGRGMDIRHASKLTGKVRLMRVRLDSGGYDKGGAYWGGGAPLYLAAGYDAEGGEANVYLRAHCRDTAKRFILARAPAVTFYR